MRYNSKGLGDSPKTKYGMMTIEQAGYLNNLQAVGGNDAMFGEKNPIMSGLVILNLSSFTIVPNREKEPYFLFD